MSNLAVLPQDCLSAVSHICVLPVPSRTRAMLAAISNSPMASAAYKKWILWWFIRIWTLHYFQLLLSLVIPRKSEYHLQTKFSFPQRTYQIITIMMPGILLGATHILFLIIKTSFQKGKPKLEENVCKTYIWQRTCI